MKFFIPFAKDADEEARIYDGIKTFLGQELGASFDKRAVRLLEYVHDGKPYRAEVGKPHLVNGESVIAILHEPGRNLYHICTPNRGVLRGMSILVGENEERRSEDFDKPPSTEKGNTPTKP